MILVTGGFGMIGAHTAAALAESGNEVIVTTHRPAETPPLLADRVRVEIVDLTERDALLALGDRYDIHTIVHLAGSIPGADVVAFFRNDTTALLNVLDAARAWRVRRFAVASSIGVYAGRAELPWTEDLALPAGPSPHPIVAFKKAAEPLVLTALAGTGIHPALLRIGSTWGPLMDPESPFSPAPRLTSALLRGERIGPFHAEDGGDFGYAVDVGRAIALLAAAPSLNNTVYNVASGGRYTYRQLADALRREIPGAQIELHEGRSADGPDPYLDISRLSGETGFTPAYDLDAAIAHYVAWRRSNPR